MKILMVYPQYPVTFWSFKHALKFVSKKSSYPPLGLLTVASMLPEDWEKKLVDMNVNRLTDDDIRWADYVFISAMVIQKESVRDVIKRCRELGVRTVAGGPLFTMEPHDYRDVDHLVLGEAEAILPAFLKDVMNGCPARLYKSRARPVVSKTPLPMWSLINMKHYSAMNIQYSRGCPFNCEFCDITILNGHRPRTKDTMASKCSKFQETKQVFICTGRSTSWAKRIPAMVLSKAPGTPLNPSLSSAVGPSRLKAI